MYGCTLTWQAGPAQQQQQGQAGMPAAEQATVVLDGSDQGLAAGQYAVLYQEGVCLGSAVIQRCLNYMAPSQ